MSEAVISFQSQLSCVMETVFKAAMYEITRLVEDSFLQEVSRCKEQVETLKKRLKWSESRRKEREPDRRGRCTDCGRIGTSAEDHPGGTEKCLKQEDEQGSQATDEELPSDEIEEDKSEVRRVSKATQSTGPGDKFAGLLKEEALQIPSGANDSHHWGVTLDDAASLPGPSKRISDPNIPKCHVNWETSFDQGPESSQGRHSGGQSEALFQSRFAMEDLSGFDKTGYGDGNMMVMGNFDGLHDSPSHLGEDLNYVAHYDEDVGPPDGVEHHVSQKGAPLNRRGAVGGSPSGSPSKANMDVGEELSCLLINEEGYLQDPNVLYPAQASAGNSGNQLSIRIQDVRSEPALNSAQNMFAPSGTYSDPLNLGERLQHPATGRGARRHNCNQCSMSFVDSASLKAHKQTHKGGAAQGSPYSCNECGKTFTQACNLRVHQKVHSGQGLHLCSHCGKGFPSFSDLKAHNCGQTGDKPYCCNVCGNKFSRLWNLKLHRRIHTQEKPHRCNMCDKSFTRADILKVHQRTHTGERPYCCAMCGLSFKRLDHLKAHRRKHMTDL